jgi:hypothetical protein
MDFQGYFVAEFCDPFVQPAGDMPPDSGTPANLAPAAPAKAILGKG